jgi:hypothetical protein
MLLVGLEPMIPVFKRAKTGLNSAGSGNEPESFNENENCGLHSIRRMAPLNRNWAMTKTNVVMFFSFICVFKG